MEPYEHFQCGDCSKRHEVWTGHYESYYECHTLKIPMSPTQKACASFEPKYSVQDSYRIYVLEQKVEDLIRWKESIESYEAEQAEYK